MFEDVLSRLQIRSSNSGVYAGKWIDKPGGATLSSVNPATGEPLAQVQSASRANYDASVRYIVNGFRVARDLN